MKTLLTFLLLSLISAQGFAASTLANYKNAIQAINYKFDRDWSSLNQQGKPDPGALATMEMFVTIISNVTGNKPGNYFMYSSNVLPPGVLVPCTTNTPSSNCTLNRVRVSNSTHNTTLFGLTGGFTLDIVVWQDNGSGNTRFLEGSYTPGVAGNSGKGNITLINCSGCSTPGHSQIEWDATSVPYHLRTRMYDTRMSNGPDVYGNMIIDATFTPSTGDLKVAAAAQNVCHSVNAADSICSSGTNDHSTGYAALVHGNMNTGNVYVWGIVGANSSTATPTNTAEQMCVKADKTQDTGSPTTCQTDGINSFTGITAYSPSSAPSSWAASGQPWPFSDVTDVAGF